MCLETRGPQDQPMTVLKSKLYIEPFQNLSNADTFSLSVFFVCGNSRISVLEGDSVCNINQQ